MRLRGCVTPVRDLTAEQRSAMFSLMDRHYENMEWPGFQADLEEKRWVILLHDAQSGTLCGFSTQTLMHVVVSGRPIHALFSGDTIVAREHWGDPALAHVWGNFALELIDQYTGELYWFLISKGYKTYRFLPLFFREFYPRRRIETPRGVLSIIDALARERYPQHYDPHTGVIRAYAGKDRLRTGLAEITPERASDPDIRFFAERNPQHAQGDELCCLAPLTRANLTRAAFRVIETA